MYLDIKVPEIWWICHIYVHARFRIAENISQAGTVPMGPHWTCHSGVAPWHGQSTLVHLDWVCWHIHLPHLDFCQLFRTYRCLGESNSHVEPTTDALFWPVDSIFGDFYLGSKFDLWPLLDLWSRRNNIWFLLWRELCY